MYNNLIREEQKGGKINFDTHIYIFSYLIQIFKNRVFKVELFNTPGIVGKGKENILRKTRKVSLDHK
jgi:hypothetical protein